MGVCWRGEFPDSLSETASILQIMTLSWDTTNKGRALKAILGWDSVVLDEMET